MGFAAGFSAGYAAVARGEERDRQKKLDERADKDYADQQAFRERIAEENRAYNEGAGAYAVPASPAAVAGVAPVANASYDRVEAQRLGVQMPQPAAELEQQRGLSLTPQETRANAGIGAPQHREDRDRIYNERLGALADSLLPPERAAQYRRHIEDLTQRNWDREAMKAFTGMASGSRVGLEKTAQLYKMIPDGYDLDTSSASFDPEKGAWSGVKMVKDGKSYDMTIDRDWMRRVSPMMDRGQVANLLTTMGQEARADKQLGIAADAQKSTEKFREAELGLRRDQLNADVADKKTARSIAWSSLSLQQQRLNFEKLKEEDAEKARDLMTRQGIFKSMFVSGGKLDAMATPEQKQERAQQELLASMATSAYMGSIEDAPTKARSTIQREAYDFAKAYGDGKLDAAKFVQEEDGTYSYGRLKGIDPNIAKQVIATAKAEPEAKPKAGATKTGSAGKASAGVSVEGGVSGMSDSTLRRIASIPGHTNQAAAQAELDRRSASKPEVDTSGIGFGRQ